MTALLASQTAGFRHEALFYDGESSFVSTLLPFLRAGIERSEPTLVAVREPKIVALREALGADADDIQFVDMDVLGHNPARIIPAWAEFVAEHAADGRPVRGVGEPICPAENPAHLIECQIHESLLNVAFADAPPWWLVCPYDTATLDESVVREACRSHPYVTGPESSPRSPEGQQPHDVAHLMASPLPEPARPSSEVAFTRGDLAQVRAEVAASAHRFGMDLDRTDALIVAAHEVAMNSLRHGGGSGVLRVWRDGDHVVFEVRDRGEFVDVLAGRRPPRGVEQRGLWLVNRLCDLVQIRTSASGSAVRVHMALAGEAEQRLIHLTLHDQLTDVGNRMMLHNRLEHALAAGMRDGRRHAVLFCDLDDFKAINDTYGHRVGDEVLVALARRLRDGARPGDTIARVGGDEFVVLCEGVARPDDAQVIALRLARTLDSPIKTSAGTLPMSMSIGVALSRPGQSADDLLGEADTTMYAAKRGRTAPPAG